jgi:hypothetical protein
LMFLFEDHLGKDTEIPKEFLMKFASSIARHTMYLLPAGILHILCGCQHRALAFNGNYILYIRIQKHSSHTRAQLMRQRPGSQQTMAEANASRVAHTGTFIAL